METFIKLRHPSKNKKSLDFRLIRKYEMRMIIADDLNKNISHMSDRLVRDITAIVIEGVYGYESKRKRNGR